MHLLSKGWYILWAKSRVITVRYNYSNCFFLVGPFFGERIFYYGGNGHRSISDHSLRGNFYYYYFFSQFFSLWWYHFFFQPPVTFFLHWAWVNKTFFGGSVFFSQFFWLFIVSFFHHSVTFFFLHLVCFVFLVSTSVPANGLFQVYKNERLPVKLKTEKKERLSKFDYNREGEK